MGFRPVAMSPFGSPYANLIGSSQLTVNPAFTGHLGSTFGGFGPIPTGFNNGFLPNGGGPAFGSSAFPGAGMGLNPFMAPTSGFFDPSVNANGTLNPFAAGNGVSNVNGGFNPAFSGAFVTPAGAVIPSGTVNDLGTTIIDRGIGAPLTSAGDVAVNRNVAASAQVSSELAQDLVTARIEGGRLVIRYSGDITIVRSITFSLLDRNRNPLKVQIINRNPAEARMTLTNRTEFYRVNVEYVGGRNQIVESRLLNGGIQANGRAAILPLPRFVSG